MHSADDGVILHHGNVATNTHAGRTVDFPEHLAVCETVIEPEEDVSEMTCIGRDVTDELELTPAVMIINRTVPPKYAARPSEDGSVRIVIALMPGRVIDKCIAGVDLLTTITLDKHVYHVPIDRQLCRLSQTQATRHSCWRSLLGACAQELR